MPEENKPTTPDDVADAVGARIIYMADSGQSTDELTAAIEAYVRLLDAIGSQAIYRL